MFRHPIAQLAYHGVGCFAAFYAFFYLVVGIQRHAAAMALAGVATVAILSAAVGFICVDRMVGLPMKSDTKKKA